jgi:hypothetical protein
MSARSPSFPSQAESQAPPCQGGDKGRISFFEQAGNISLTPGFSRVIIGKKENSAVSTRILH